MREELEITAYHEAAHAVAAWFCGIQVTEVSVERDKNRLGYTQFSYTAEQNAAKARDDPSLLLPLILIGLAGMAGDHAHWKWTQPIPPNEALVGDYMDQEQVLDRLRRIGYDKPTDFDACLGTATRLFSRDDVWAVVDKLAQALMKHKKLNGKQLDVFAAATPRVNADFWDFMERGIEYFRQGG